MKTIVSINNLKVNIRKLIRRKSLKKLLNPQNHQPQPHLIDRGKWIRLPYLGDSTEKLTKALRKLNYCPAFYSLTTINQLLVIQRSPQHEKI